ncbi:hypothetical protein BgiMline_010064 [Biomphalaria glabrata]
MGCCHSSSFDILSGQQNLPQADIDEYLDFVHGGDGGSPYLFFIKMHWLNNGVKEPDLGGGAYFPRSPADGWLLELYQCGF